MFTVPQCDQHQGAYDPNCVLQTQTTTGAQCSVLVKLIKLLPVKGAIQFNRFLQHSDSVNIELLNEAGTSFSADLRLMDLDTDELSIPDIDFNVNITYNTAELRSILNSIGDITDTVDLSVDDSKQFIIRGAGELGSIECALPYQEGSIDGPLSQVKVSVRYIKMFLKIGGGTENVLLRIELDNPVNFQFKIKDESLLQFYVAPKINDDDITS